jgi:hypothetical protein
MKTFNEKLTMNAKDLKQLELMIDAIPENKPLYKDSGQWQVRTDDMEEVLFQQKLNEDFFDFIKRVYEADNLYMHI